MFGQFELEFNPSKHGSREHARNQNSREQAAQNQKKQIVSGIYGRENDDQNHAEIDDSLARQLVIHLVRDPAQAGAFRERRHERDRYPTGKPQRSDGRRRREPDSAFLRNRRRKQCQYHRHRKRRHRNGEQSPSGAIAFAPEPCDEG